MTVALVIKTRQTKQPNDGGIGGNKQDKPSMTVNLVDDKQDKPSDQV